MKMYITKYALTEPVVLREALDQDDDGYVWVDWPGGLNGKAMFRIGKDAHVTIEAAEARFNEMVAAKAKSLERQLANLRAMKFKVIKS